MSRVDLLPQSLRSRAGWAEYFEAQRPAQPHLHQIEPTNHCPYSCVMCPRPTGLERTLGFIPLERFQQVVDQVAGYDEPVRSREIELFHFGESLLHPDLPEMIGYAADRGLTTVLSVNAPHLTPDRALAALAARPTKMIVSLDGDDAETYAAVRGPVADFDRAVANLEAMAPRLAEFPETSVVLRMIRLTANEAQHDTFAERWRALGYTTETRPFFPWTEADLTTVGEHERYLPFMPCPFPWKHLVVQWDGNVVPCCRDLNGELSLGHVDDTPLEEIWNGPGYAELRRQHATGDYGDNALCERCMALYYTEE